MSKRGKLILLFVGCAIGGAVICGLVSLVFYFGDWNRVLIASLIGAFIGLVGAPEIDRKAFAMPALFQTVSGSIASGIIGMVYTQSIEGLLLSIVIGGFLGFLAPYWVRYAPIP